MKYLTYLLHDRIIDQIPTDMTDDEAIDLDGFLRKNGLIGEAQEIAVVEDTDRE